MILGDFSRTLTSNLGAVLRSSGDSRTRIRGLAVDEAGSGWSDGWIEPGEVAVTGRESLAPEFLEGVRESGSPALVWRRDGDSSVEVAEKAEKLGLGLLVLSPEVPLRALLAVLSDNEGLLAHSHWVARTLLENTEGDSSSSALTQRIADLFGRPLVVEDPVGRLVTRGSGNGSERLAAFLTENGLRASKGSGFDETRRERRDRYARLPDGFLSVPVERWRAGGRELFWTPIGFGAPAGYLWMDLEGASLTPEDVVLLYWSRKVLEAELGKDRVRLETELGVRGDFVDDLVSGHYGSLDLMLQRAGYLGADLSSGAVAMIVDIDDFARYLSRRKLEETAIQELKRRLADAVRLQARELFSNFLTGPRSDNVILFIGPSKEESPSELPEKAWRLAAQVQRYVQGLLPDLTVSIGIGRYAADPGSIPAAYSEAEVALEIGHRIHGPSAVSTFEDIGSYKLLFRVLQDDPAELEAFYGETLEPVVAYDSRYSTELTHTLVTYLRNDASTVKTASELFAHRHTIRYRLDRVKELTGLDVDRSEDRERITLGIKAMQLLGELPPAPSSFSDR